MADPHEDPDDPIPDDPESRFLIALWDHLERAYVISVEADVIVNLAEIERLCTEAAGLIRAYRAV